MILRRAVFFDFFFNPKKSPNCGLKVPPGATCPSRLFEHLLVPSLLMLHPTAVSFLSATRGLFSFLNRQDRAFPCFFTSRMCGTVFSSPEGHMVISSLYARSPSTPVKSKTLPRFYCFRDTHSPQMSLFHYFSCAAAFLPAIFLPIIPLPSTAFPTATISAP